MQIDKKSWFTEQSRRAGYASLKAFAEDVDLDSSKLSKVFNGTREVKAKEVDLFAAKLRCSSVEVKEILGLPLVPEVHSIAGYVGAADRVVIYTHDDVDDEGVTLPFFNYPGRVLRVRGESMLPRYKPGELIGIRLPGREWPSAKMLGQDVVAKLADDQIVLKTIVAGAAPATFTLLSVNPMVPPIYDASIEWIAPIDFHLPRSW